MKSDFDTDTGISELRIVIHKIWAVARAFDAEFVEGTPEQDSFAVNSSQDRYIHLYSVLSDLISSAVTIADTLDA